MLRPRPTTPARQDVETRDLWKWVDLLTVDQEKKLRRRHAGQRTARVEHVKIPSLWTQLVEALASSSSGGGTGKAGAGSRSPIHIPAAALVMDVERMVLNGLTELGARPRTHLEHQAADITKTVAPALLDDYGLPLLDPVTAGSLTERAARPAADERARRDTARIVHDISSDLRQLAQLIASTRDQLIVDIWVRRYRSWVTRTETTLALEDASVDLRPQWGRACTCLALWVTFEQDGEQRREPALVAEFRDHQLQHLLCRACGTDWRDDLDELTEWLAANEATYGDARTWGLTVPRRDPQEAN